ncbi:MAG: PIN domain-containing protein [Candidatus Sigynarchaeota archaeon]
MNETIAIIDTNFFVGLMEVVRSFDEIADFIKSMQASFVENNIKMVLCSRVMAELDKFDPTLAMYLEINFKVHPPVDVDKDQFFLNLKWINSQRRHDMRWFNVDEITDLEVLTVAKHIQEDSTGRGEHPDIVIVSNDEGLQKAADFFFNGLVKVQDPAVFLTILLGVTDDKKAQSEIAETAKRLFHYFTSYRTSRGRPPVRQLDAFFAEIQNAIRLAREDIEPYFKQGTIQAFERYMITGKPFKNDIVVYEPALAIVKGLLTLPTDEFLKTIDERLHELFLAFNTLARSLNEPTDFTRFYNYISIYLIRLYLDAFKRCFIARDLAASYKYMALAKSLVQGLANQPSAHRLYFSILIAEATFAIITGFMDSNYVAATIDFLANAIRKRQLPSLISPDQVYLLIAISQYKDQKGIEVTNDAGRNCEYRETGLRCTREYFNGLLLHIEQFCDELTSFGQHELALKILTQLYKVLPAKSDEANRVEGKIYLICLILQQAIPSCVGDVFPKSWEKTNEPLEKENTHESFTAFDAASKAYKSQIKILSFNAIKKEYLCWIYPLKSRFKLIIPPEIEIKNPAALKELKIQSGSIKVIPASQNADLAQYARGTIELGKDCQVQTRYYEEKFFTLNLI